MDDKVLKGIGSRMYHACNKRGMTIRTLAEKTGISDSCLYKFKRGEVNITIINLLKICNALNVDLNYLMGYVNEKD